METTKKTIKLDFCGFWSSFNKEKNLFVNILSRYFDIEICDKPDFVICSNRGMPFEYMKYDCVRIMYMGENMSPDFTVFDYCIGFDYLVFGDRYFRLPFAFYNDGGKPWIPEILTEDMAWQILKNKKYFCNFIYGHESSHGMRERLFKELSAYKDVISPGSYLNNTVKDGKAKKRCSWREKDQYLIESKFTIAGDSIVYPGFVTEKIVQPFEKHSIPIYFGNPLINRDFNEKAFVWCRSETDLKSIIDEVEYLDTHDDAYVEMLMQKPLADKENLNGVYEALEAFLVNIFKQDKYEAYRRVRFFAAANHERYLKEYADRYNRTPQFVRDIKDKLSRS